VTSHWSFLEITDSWGVKIVDPANQWEDFKKLYDSRPEPGLEGHVEN
jgi:hypothetical protein